MSEEETPPKSYAVGYARPPAEHRFPKGRSGNPNGRPRKTAIERPRVDPANEPALEMLLAEAYRPVSIREGDRQIELPMIQAVFRSLGVSAIKGNRQAAQVMAALVSTVEADKRDQKFEYFKAMYEYRESWLREFELCDQAGKPRPDPAPHPDDMEFFPKTGDVFIRGPWTDEQRDAMYGLCDLRDELIEENDHWREMDRAVPDPANEARIRINETIIARYEATLPERMRRCGNRARAWLKQRLAPGKGEGS